MRVIIWALVRIALLGFRICLLEDALLEAMCVVLCSAFLENAVQVMLRCDLLRRV